MNRISGKRRRLFVYLAVALTLVLYLLATTVDTIKTGKIRNDIVAALNPKLISHVLTAEPRTKSLVGNYYIPDIQSSRVQNDVMNQLYPQVLERVNGINDFHAPPFLTRALIISNIDGTRQSDPLGDFNVEVEYQGFFGRLRTMMVRDSFVLPQFQTSEGTG